MQLVPSKTTIPNQANQKDDNAIYLDNPDATLNFHLKNNGTIAMYDNIRGASVKVTETDEDGNEIVDEDGNALTSTKHYSVNITGDLVLVHLACTITSTMLTLP